MDESIQRELAELRALLAKYGPASVLGAVGALCAEAVETGNVTGDDATVWMRVSTRANDVARSILSGEDEAETATSTSDPGDDDPGDNDPNDDDPGDNDPNDDDDPNGNGDPNDEGEAPVATAPIPKAPAAEAPNDAERGTPDEQSRAPEARGEAARESEDTTMAKTSEFGPRPPQATAWRCQRIDSDGKRTGERLTYGEGRVNADEWPLKSCTVDTILERWGEGRYILQYVRFDENGRRRPCGRSRVIDLVDNSPKPREPPAPIPPPIAPMAPTFMAGGMGGDPTFANVFSLMTYLNEQSERARATAAADARAAIERANVEAKLVLERYKADREFELERMRLESAEKLAAIQANARFAHRAGNAPVFDPDTLASKIGDAVGAKIDAAARANDEDDDDDAAPMAFVPADHTGKLIDAMRETFGPVLTVLMTKLTEQAAPPIVPQGLGHAAE